MSNIITARFDGKTSCKTDPAYQYDYGQILYFSDLSLPTSFEVHFANAENGTSVTQIGSNNRVTIPDSVFQGSPNYYTKNIIYAWVFLHTGDSDGETEYRVTIPLTRRAEPSDDEPTPVQQSAITQAIAQLNNAVSTVEGYLGNYAPCIAETASGDIASFDDGAYDTPMKSLIVNIEPQQSGTGTPSPSNIRAITGASGCHITVTNSNLLGGDITEQSATFSNGTFTNTGTDTRSNLNLQIQLWNESTYVSAAGANISSTGEKTITFTVPSNVTSLKLKHNGSTLDLAVVVPFYALSGTFTFACTVEGYDPTTVGGIVLRNCRINAGSTALDYEAYNGTTYPVTWSDNVGTIYGGYADIVKGTLTKTHEMMTITSTSPISKDSDAQGYHRFYLQNDNIKKLTRYTEYLTANVCTAVPNYANFEGYSGILAVTGYPVAIASNYLYLISNSISTVADMKTWLETTPLQVVYPLATPVTYNIGAEQIKSLLGTNNVFADCGSIASCKYVADTKKYIDNAIATAIASL